MKSHFKWYMISTPTLIDIMRMWNAAKFYIYFNKIKLYNPLPDEVTRL